MDLVGKITNKLDVGNSLLKTLQAIDDLEAERELTSIEFRTTDVLISTVNSSHKDPQEHSIRFDHEDLEARLTKVTLQVLKDWALEQFKSFEESVE